VHHHGTIIAVPQRDFPLFPAERSVSRWMH
jgi:hypothetical protein